MSNSSPRKDRTPFRPLNSLHLARQPEFSARQASPSKHSHMNENSHLTIGDNSSLFDSSEGSILDGGVEVLAPVIPVQYTPRKQPTQSNMVNEREAPRPVNVSPQKGVRQSVDDVPARSQNTARPRDTVPNRAQIEQPAFGQASPLRNPLKKDYSNVFNPNQRRAEHHRPAASVPAPVFRDPRAIIASAAPRAQPGFANPGDKARSQQSRVPSNPLFAPIQNPLYAQHQRYPPQSSTAQPQPIRVPTNIPPKAIPAAKPPTFSSLGPNTTFQPYRVPAPPKKTVDLTGSDDEEDGFDPNAALREDKFGGADPYSYIDAGQTSQNIKALLEGAFEDDEEKPKIKLRKRAKKPVKQEKPKEDKKVKSLEEKLMQLELDTAKKEEPEEQPKEEEAPEEDDEDEEDGTVEGLKVNLLPHQVDGVAWMTDKEIGMRKKNGILPKGGILADDMGLGKTVQSVTLILTNPRPALDAKPPPENPKQKMPGKTVGKGTLVVAPLALIKQWEAEIKDKVEKDHALKVLVHHGPSRTKSHSELKKYDVVITTYQILASEHAASSDNDDGPKIGCFGVHWYRVILDEAHSIKNRNAKSTQACYALKSWYRWCLTGTPMQNNLDELQSLIAFLRIKPYNNLGTWKEQITGPMKNGKGQFAIKRVQYFLKGFMKRRTKDILKQEGALNFGGKSKNGEKKGPGMQIVKREVETIVCDLDPQERDFYDQLQERAQNRLNDMMAGAKTDYIGALVLLLRLRQACNHPQLISGSMGKDKDALSTGQQSSGQKESASVDDELDALTGALGGLTVETKLCDVCNVRLSPQEAATGSPRCTDCEGLTLHTPGKVKKHKKEKKAKKIPELAAAPTRKVRNRRVILDSDDENDEGEGEGDWLVDESQQKLPDLGRAGGTDDEDAEGGGETLDSIDTVSDEEERSALSRVMASESEADDSDDGSDYGSSPDPSMPVASTKIRKLLRILHTETPEHKTIVFSQFTSMLDIIEPHLKKASIRYVRYDGSMKNDAREAALESLRNNKATRVLLCSLKCGSLGLNLTAASRVVIVEPFWNPFVEEQAIDRVHRLNQTVDVKVFKLTVGNTVEERIIELQEKKRELAKAAIEGGKAVAKLSMKDIMSLFGRNAEDTHVEEEKGKTIDYSMPKVTRAEDKKKEGRSSGSAERQVGWSNGPLSYDRNDRRGGYERSSGGRIRNEDPVYGRR